MESGEVLTYQDKFKLLYLTEDFLSLKEPRQETIHNVRQGARDRRRGPLGNHVRAISQLERRGRRRRRRRGRRMIDSHLYFITTFYKKYILLCKSYIFLFGFLTRDSC